MQNEGMLLVWWNRPFGRKVDVLLTEIQNGAFVYYSLQPSFNSQLPAFYERISIIFTYNQGTTERVDSCPILLPTSWMVSFK